MFMLFLTTLIHNNMNPRWLCISPHMLSYHKKLSRYLWSAIFLRGFSCKTFVLFEHHIRCYPLDIGQQKHYWLNIIKLYLDLVSSGRAFHWLDFIILRLSNTEAYWRTCNITIKQSWFFQNHGKNFEENCTHTLRAIPFENLLVGVSALL